MWFERCGKGEIHGNLFRYFVVAPVSHSSGSRRVWSRSLFASTQRRRYVEDFSYRPNHGDHVWSGEAIQAYSSYSTRRRIFNSGSRNSFRLVRPGPLCRRCCIYIYYALSLSLSLSLALFPFNTSGTKTHHSQATTIYISGFSP